MGDTGHFIYFVGSHFGNFRGEVEHLPYFLTEEDRNSLATSTKTSKLQSKGNASVYSATGYK